MVDDNHDTHEEQQDTGALDTQEYEESAHDVAFLAHHKIDTLIEVLIEKGIVKEDDLRKKSEELSVVDEDADEEEPDEEEES